MARFKKGDVVRCVESPDYLERHISVGTEYVVNKAEVTPYGHEYLLVLGDNNQGCNLFHTLFAASQS